MLLWPENQDEVRVSDMSDRYAERPAINWLPARGLDELRRLAYNRGLWEDLGNGYLTKKPKKKQASVQVVAESEPNDRGEVRLRITSQNAGPRPLIYYAENGPASENSPQLLDQLLTTSALRVSFFVRDPSGQYETGAPVVWENALIIRNSLNDTTDPRQLELLVAPKGTLRYTLDGSEPRESKVYTSPLDLDDEEVRVLVFAEADGLEARANFTFPAKGGEGVRVDPVKPGRLVARGSGHRLDSRAKTFLGLQLAATLGVQFEKLTLTVGQGSKMAGNSDLPPFSGPLESGASGVLDLLLCASPNRAPVVSGERCNFHYLTTEK